MKVKKQVKNLIDLIEKFPNEDACRLHLEKQRWGDKITCPHCNSSDKIYRCKDGLYKCSKCRKMFSVKIGTIFEDSHIPLQKWFMSIYLLFGHKKGISSVQLSKDISVTQKTAWFMKHRIREMIKTGDVSLSKIVEVDETYIGGKHKGKRGRGSENKTAVVGLAQRGGNIKTQPVEKVDRITIENIIKKYVDKDATIMTDEWKSYKNLSRLYAHQVVNHGSGEFVKGNAHTNNIEGFWGLFKRALVCIYYQVSKKHLHRYCSEFEFKYNTRKVSDPERFNLVLSQCVGRLTYKELIEKV